MDPSTSRPPPPPLKRTTQAGHDDKRDHPLLRPSTAAPLAAAGKTRSDRSISSNHNNNNRNDSHGSHGNSTNRRYWQPPPQTIAPKDLDAEKAETDLIRNLEQQPPRTNPRRNSTTLEDLPDSLYAFLQEEGEVSQRPPPHPPKRRSVPRLAEVARRVQLARRASQKNMSSTPAGQHRKRQPSLAQDLLESLQKNDRVPNNHGGDEDDDDDDEIFPGIRENQAEGLLISVGIQPAHRHHPADELTDAESELEISGDDDDDDEEEEDGEPLLPVSSTGEKHGPPASSGYGSVLAGLQQTRHRRQVRKFSWWKRSQRCLVRLCSRPQEWATHIGRRLLFSFVVMLGLPLCILAWIFYYYLGNPELDFLPGEARLSWWFNFGCRQLVTLELARISQWLLLDCLILGLQRYSVKLLGPLVNLAAVQAKGWPFLMASWALWDLCVLHGDNQFQAHWLFWTGLKIYSEANSGSYILSSNAYLRFLLCMLLAGCAVIVKRTVMVISFSRRQFTDFKPRMEKLLQEVVLLTEVANIAEEADLLSEHNSIDEVKKSMDDLNFNRKRGLSDMVWPSVQFEDDAESTEGEESSQELATAGKEGNFQKSLSRTPSGSIRLADLLDRWQEPPVKTDKASSVTILDLLKFRKALSYINEPMPFGQAFGPANTREECITSAHNLFWKLLKLSPGSSAVRFDDLSLVLIPDDEGEVDLSKRAALRKLFQPDANNELPLLAFIQSCDAVYKKVRFLRASVLNSEVIDHVLDHTINAVFWFVLTLFLLSLLNFNPWPVLVSITSLLVSVSFALGPSLSKYVEGLLLIAVRRPYDLGDRIFLTNAENIVNPGHAYSWFVEGINLFTTTLRFARTNEVSTINNWSISASRIVNCNRSPNAIVFVENKLHIAVLQDGKLAKFRKALETFVRHNPRTWHSVLFCRLDDIDGDNEVVSCTVALRHRASWQDAGRILINRSELLQFVYETTLKLGVKYETPPPRRLIYEGGVLEKGQVIDFKKNLLAPDNIHSPPDDHYFFRGEGDARPGLRRPPLPGHRSQSSGSFEPPIPGS